MWFGLCYIADHHPEIQGDYREWYEGMIEEAVVADRLGYQGIFLAEHHFPHFAFGGPAVFLAAIARDTERIRLGTAVSIITLNDPLRLAEDYAMVDVLSNGRLDFGVGRGAYKYDYDACRIDMATSRERFEENLRFIDTAWSNLVFDFEGTWTTVHEHSVHPRPVQQPRPPIWVGASLSKESFRRAGLNGYNLETVPFFYDDPTDLRERLDIYLAALVEAGHDPATRQVCGAYLMFCAETEDEVERIARPAIERFQRFGKMVDESRHAYRDPVAYAEFLSFNAGKSLYESREALTFDNFRQSRAVVGTPARCRERIQEIQELYGLDHLILEVNSGAVPHDAVVRSLELFADQVMPAFPDDVLLSA